MSHRARPTTNLKKINIMNEENLILDRIKEAECRAGWLTPIIPAFWEAEAGVSRGQEIETILVNKVKPCLY